MYLIIFLRKQLIKGHVYWIFFKSIVSFTSRLISSQSLGVFVCAHDLRSDAEQSAQQLTLKLPLAGRWCTFFMHIFNMGQNNRFDHFLFSYLNTHSLNNSTFFFFLNKFGVLQIYTLNIRVIHFIFWLLCDKWFEYFLNWKHLDYFWIMLFSIS